mgnify:CR=1 FL=1
MSSMDDSSQPSNDPIWTGSQWVMPGTATELNIRLNLPPTASRLNTDNWAWEDDSSQIRPEGFIMPAGAILNWLQLQAPAEGQRLSEFVSQSLRSIVVIDPPVDSFDVVAPTGEPICRPATDENNDVSGEVIRAQGVPDSPKVDLLFPSEVVIKMLETTGAPSGSLLYFTYGDFLQWWRDHAPQTTLAPVDRDENGPYRFKSDHKALFRTTPFEHGVINLPSVFKDGDFRPTGDGLGMAAKIFGVKNIDRVEVRPFLPDPSYDNWEEEQQRRNDAMLAYIRSAKLEARDVLVMLYVQDRLIRAKGLSVHIDFHELLDFEGIGDRRTRSFNKEQADRYDRLFTLASQTRFWMISQPRFVSNKKPQRIDAYESPPFLYSGRHATWQQNLPGLGPPENYELQRFEYHVTASHHIEQMRRNPSLLQSWLGGLKAIAEIQSGKPSGNWAKAIGLVLVPHARINASHIIKLKRSTLLETVTVDPTPTSILEGPRPTNAQDHFTAAMGMLKKKRVIAGWKDPTPAKNLPRGWREGWLDQTIEVTMGDEYKKQLELIASKRPGSQKRLPKPPEK